MQLNKASQSDLRKLSSFLQKDAKKQPIHSGSCWRRYVYFHRKNNMKISPIFLLTILIASCSSTYIQKGVNEEFRGTYATFLTGDKKDNKEGRASIIHITHINGRSVGNSLSVPRWPSQALLNPGINSITVMYPNAFTYYRSCMWIDAKAGETYHLKAIEHDDSMTFWIQATEANTKRGGLCGTEPES